ncbi:hypothetical protein [Arthrobacter sp. UM1]|uniref:hypothetical protein n=1 Tax=Arthrobacter sp. UM1 TaxID=2766776 RepID=UPI001CF6B136|nr:hypothetical protein [Arthrobacter sp. UM1]MCB4207406.1 hypothetical protein [Arthrobacter sp. UM1]
MRTANIPGHQHIPAGMSVNDLPFRSQPVRTIALGSLPAMPPDDVWDKKEAASDVLWISVREEADGFFAVEENARWLAEVLRLRVPVEISVSWPQLFDLADVLGRLSSELVDAPIVVSPRGGMPMLHPLSECSAVRWRLCTAELARVPAVFIKLSGMYDACADGLAFRRVRLRARPYIRAVMRTFGAERCIMGLPRQGAELQSAEEREAWVEDILASIDLVCAEGSFGDRTADDVTDLMFRGNAKWVYG